MENREAVQEYSIHFQVDIQFRLGYSSLRRQQVSTSAVGRCNTSATQVKEHLNSWHMSKRNASTVPHTRMYQQFAHEYLNGSHTNASTDEQRKVGGKVGSLSKMHKS